MSTKQRFENEILRPAVLRALSALPYWTGHVAPVEALYQQGRRRSAAELGKGCPDILGSIKWTRLGAYGAQFVALELKAPKLEPGHLCTACFVVVPYRSPGRTACCGALQEALVRAPTPGRVDEDQQELHDAWRSQGRIVFVVRSPQEAVDAVEGAAQALRCLGLAVEERP